MPRHPLRQPPPGWQLAYHDAPDPGNPVFGSQPAGWYLLHNWQLTAGPFKERWYAVERAYALEAKKAEEGS